MCTAQYFLWYFALLPFALAQMTVSTKQLLVTYAIWMCAQVRRCVSLPVAGMTSANDAQVHWLLWAGLLELQGYNTFWSVWFAGIVFFGVNIGVICSFLRYHSLASATVSTSPKQS